MFATQKGRSKPVRISCKRSEKVNRCSRWIVWRGRPRPRSSSTAKPFADLLGCQACYSNHFVPAGQAGCNSNGGTRYLQKLCEKFDAGFVGLAVDGRRGKRNLQRVADFAG